MPAVATGGEDIHARHLEIGDRALPRISHGDQDSWTNLTLLESCHFQARPSSKSAVMLEYSRLILRLAEPESTDQLAATASAATHTSTGNCVARCSGDVVGTTSLYRVTRPFLEALVQMVLSRTTHTQGTLNGGPLKVSLEPHWHITATNMSPQRPCEPAVSCSTGTQLNQLSLCFCHQSLWISPFHAVPWNVVRPHPSHHDACCLSEASRTALQWLGHSPTHAQPECSLRVVHRICCAGFNGACAATHGAIKRTILDDLVVVDVEQQITPSCGRSRAQRLSARSLAALARQSAT